MTGYGVRRGLAASAVGALLITGVAVTAGPSYAASDSVRMISQNGRVASTKPDGTGPYVGGIRLVAERLDTSADVAFEVNANPKATDATPGWTTLLEPSTADPSFATLEWDGWDGTQSLLGRRVALRVSGSVGGEAPTYSTVNDVLLADETSPVESVHIPGFSGGYFVQPYASTSRTKSLVAVSGQTSATEGTVALTPWRSATGTFGGRVDAAVTPTDLKVQSEVPGVPESESVYTEGGAFRGVLERAAFGAADGDSVAVRAERDSDDVVSALLHPQTINSIGLADSRPTASGTEIELQVNDTGSYPVAGAEVRRQDGTLVGYTDGAGRVALTQANATTATYYVNTTDADAYDGATDQQTEVTTTAFSPTPSAIEARLAHGKVFDDDEYDAGDLALQVVDQAGDPMPGARSLSYSFYPTGGTEPMATTASTNAAGRLVVPFDPAAADGHWSLDYEGVGSSRRTTFVAGDATLRLSPTAAKAPSGGTITYAGQLTVGAWPVAGRAVALTFARGTEAVPGRDADAGVLLGGKRRLAATATTSAKGTVTVRVADAQEPGKPTESGGRLTATAVDAAEKTTATATFGSGKGTLELKLKGASTGAAGDRLTITGTPALAGERVTVLARTGKAWKSVKTAVLGGKGGLKLTLKDRNGARPTSYRVRLLTSDRVASSASATVEVE